MDERSVGERFGGAAEGEGELMMDPPLSNSAMFTRVMSDPELFRQLAEVVTGVRLEPSTDNNVEQTIEPVIGARGVRMDVVAADDGRVIDVEMQARSEPRLGKRLRYYQSTLDVHHLRKGDDYSRLRESFIVFLCTFGAFGLGLPAYHLERACAESAEVHVGDESHWTVLNASAYKGETHRELAAVLEYVATGSVRKDDPFVNRVDAAVRHANGDRKWVEQVYSVMSYEENVRMRYSILARQEVAEKVAEKVAEEVEEKLAAVRQEAVAEGRAEGREEGREEGRAEGREEGREEERAAVSRLAAALKAEGRESELIEALSDSGTLAALMREYGC